MIFFSRLEFVPAQINGQKNTIAARDLGLWVGCTAVLLLYCLLYRDPRSMPPNTVRTSSQHSTPAHLVWLFFSLCPWRLKSSLTEDGRGPLAPARPEPLYLLIVSPACDSTRLTLPIGLWSTAANNASYAPSTPTISRSL